MSNDQKMYIMISIPFVWLAFCLVLFLLPISQDDKLGMIGLGGTILGVTMLMIGGITE